MTPTMQASDPIVQIIDVHKSFGPLHVLRGIDLAVSRGEVVCVLGPSGSGKSTLLRCINHLEQVSSNAWRSRERSRCSRS